MSLSSAQTKNGTKRNPRRKAKRFGLALSDAPTQMLMHFSWNTPASAPMQHMDAALLSDSELEKPKPPLVPFDRSDNSALAVWICSFDLEHRTVVSHGLQPPTSLSCLWCPTSKTCTTLSQGDLPTGKHTAIRIVGLLTEQSLGLDQDCGM